MALSTSAIPSSVPSATDPTSPSPPDVLSASSAAAADPSSGASHPSIFWIGTFLVSRIRSPAPRLLVIALARFLALVILVTDRRGAFDRQISLYSHFGPGQERKNTESKRLTVSR